MTADEKSAWAGEYVVGTLSAEERRAFEAAAASDPELAALRREWEQRLAGLADTIPRLAPPAAAWDNISAAIDRRTEAPREGNVVALRRRLANWRAATFVTGALAAGLAAVLILGPSASVPEPDGARYVAVVNRGGDLPALLVDVDTATGLIAVRSLAAEAQPGRSNELWYIAEGRDPLSLGTIDRVGAELLVSIEGIPDFETTNAVFAITDEPLGGAPGGVPTGEVVYLGTLVPAPDRN